jgi:HD superfamily phosphohydrolase
MTSTRSKISSVITFQEPCEVTTFDKCDVSKEEAKYREPLIGYGDEQFIKHDPIYKLVVLPRAVQHVINHRWFQRMAKIRQLGPIIYSEKQATHTRYEHSIGVGYLAYICMNHLRSKYDEITVRESMYVTLAGLLHDVGHGPYSHSFDVTLKASEKHKDKPYIRHEYRSQAITQELLRELVDDKVLDFTQAEINTVMYFIDGKSYKKYWSADENIKANPKLIDDCNYYPNDILEFYHGIEQIVNNIPNQLDVDKLDYIQRDSIYLGFAEKWKGKINTITDIIEKSLIIGGMWVFHYTAFPNIIEYMHRRLSLYVNVYNQQDFVSIDMMIREAFQKADAVINITGSSDVTNKHEIEAFCELTDDDIIARIMLSIDPRIKPAKTLIESVLKGEPTYNCNGTYAAKEMPNSFGRVKFEKYGPYSDASAPDIMMGKIRFCDDEGRLIQDIKDYKFYRSYT